MGLPLNLQKREPLVTYFHVKPLLARIYLLDISYVFAYFYSLCEGNQNAHSYRQ
jgi:hypothetical protein